MNIPKDKFEALVKAGELMAYLLGGKVTSSKAWAAALADIRKPPRGYPVFHPNLGQWWWFYEYKRNPAGPFNTKKEAEDHDGTATEV